MAFGAWIWPEYVFHVFIRHMNVYFSMKRLDMIGLERDQTSDRYHRQSLEGKDNKVTILIVTMMPMLPELHIIAAIPG